MSSKGKRGGYVTAQVMAESNDRISRRECEDMGVSNEELATANDAARKHLRPSSNITLERTGEVKQGSSPKFVRRSLVEDDYERMNLPKEHRRAHSRLIQDERAREVIGNYGGDIIGMVKSGTGLFLIGPNGAGKSSVAAILAKETVRWGLSAYFISHDELSDIRYNDEASKERALMMSKVRSVDLLVLDNFDEKFLEDRKFGPSELERVVRRRNGSLLATIITTRVATKIGARDKDGKSLVPDLIDTINARMATLKVPGDDMRAMNQAKVKAKVFGKGTSK